MVSGLVRLGFLGPFDFDDPVAQPSEQEGNSGDDWQWVDAASSMLLDGSFGAAGFVRRAGGVEHVVHEDYFCASSFDGAKQGFVFRSGVSGLGYYQDRKNAPSFEEHSVLSQWPAYLKALGDMAPGLVQGSGAR